MNWNPSAGEALLLRGSVSFATGVAPKVGGLRSFRDTNRQNIEAELEGWPDGPGFTPHGKASQVGGQALKLAVTGIPRLINLITNVGAPSGTLVEEPGWPDKPTEPDNEVEDFPVIWAAPDTLARTLPWQLDPSRCPNDYRTDLALTDERIIILGAETDADGDHSETRVLWEVPRTAVAHAERMSYSWGLDVRIHFTDRSWTRLKARDCVRLVGHLRGKRRRVTQDKLTSAQRTQISELIRNPPLQADRSSGSILPVEEPPVLERLPDGNVAIYLSVPSSKGPDRLLTLYVDPSGQYIVPKDNV